MATGKCQNGASCWDYYIDYYSSKPAWEYRCGCAQGYSGKDCQIRTRWGCDDDIAANHMESGNKKYRKCPKHEGAVCTVRKADGAGFVNFRCMAGAWVLEHIENEAQIREMFQVVNETLDATTAEFLVQKRQEVLADPYIISIADAIANKFKKTSEEVLNKFADRNERQLRGAMRKFKQ